MSQRLRLVHVELKEANAFVGSHHRHHKPVQGHRFSLGAEQNDILVGVAIVGRPVARGCDWRSTVEITRLCTDGTRNACSFLYGASARAAKALGYKVIQTYILESENGASLRASNFLLSHTTAGGTWNQGTFTGRREDQPQCPKQCWKQVFE